MLFIRPVILMHCPVCVTQIFVDIVVQEILDQLNQGRVAKMAHLEEEIKLQESVEPMLQVGKDVFEILRVCLKLVQAKQFLF